LLELSNHAPTGGNRQGISFNAVYSSSEMGKFRERFYTLIEKAVSDRTLPEEGEFLANFASGFREGGNDVLFRDAPHVYFAVGPEDKPIIHTDGVIAATYFELAAFAFGYGALWNGFVVYAINNVPGLRDLIGLGPDEVVCYALCFGIPDITFQRTVQRNDIKAVELKGF
jgi:nitroreductase